MEIVVIKYLNVEFIGVYSVVIEVFVKYVDKLVVFYIFFFKSYVLKYVRRNCVVCLLLFLEYVL